MRTAVRSLFLGIMLVLAGTAVRGQELPSRPFALSLPSSCHAGEVHICNVGVEPAITAAAPPSRLVVFVAASAGSFAGFAVAHYLSGQFADVNRAADADLRLPVVAGVVGATVASAAAAHVVTPEIPLMRAARNAMIAIAPGILVGISADSLSGSAWAPIAGFAIGQGLTIAILAR